MSCGLSKDPREIIERDAIVKKPVMDFIQCIQEKRRMEFSVRAVLLFEPAKKDELEWGVGFEKEILSKMYFPPLGSVFDSQRFHILIMKSLGANPC